MDKRYLHHLRSAIRPVKTWYLAVAFLALAGCSAFTLRQNNLHMVSLRDKVYIADQQNTDVEAALQKLRSYVTTHMNTQLSSGTSAVYPPIQLKYTYERLQQAEQTRVQQASASIYTDAQKTCEAQYPDSFSGGPRVPCIENYVDQHGVKVNKISDALYKFDFASPTWSPDLAGWLVVASVFLLICVILRWLLGRFLP